MRNILYRKIVEVEEVPRFFLPVRRLDYGRFRECYFILIAPFVLFLQIIKDIGYVVWMDLLEFSYLVAQSANEKKGKSD